MKEINGRRKEREGGKRAFLKDKPVLSTEEAEKARKATTGRRQSRKEKGSAVRNGLYQLNRRQRVVRMIVLTLRKSWLPRSLIVLR